MSNDYKQKHIRSVESIGEHWGVFAIQPSTGENVFFVVSDETSDGSKTEEDVMATAVTFFDKSWQVQVYKSIGLVASGSQPYEH